MHFCPLLFSKIWFMKTNFTPTFERTKIIATLGPTSNSYSQLKALAKAGVDMFRLNFSHANYDEIPKIIEDINRVNEELGTHVGIIADLQGPKLRIGEIKDGSIQVEAGDILTFVNQKVLGTKEAIYMSYEGFARDVKVGEKILIDDGKLVFEVLESNQKDKVKLKTVFGGTLSSNKGVNLPDTAISLPCLTQKDLSDLAFILEQPVHWIALSFVRSASDIVELRKYIDQHNHYAKIIAKIEKPEALDNINAIIDESDAIMIARGDLAVEVRLERLPAIQKSIIKKCINRSRPVIVATQLMESMITNPYPTRAEITDVANSVMDGTDAVMLSAETSVGAHPVKVVEIMRRILAETEKSLDWGRNRADILPFSNTFASDVVCLNAVNTGELLDAKAIVGITVSGYTAFKISSFRPKSKIFIFSNQKHILNTLNLVWGVTCYLHNNQESTDNSIDDTLQILQEYHHVNKGDYVINTGTMPLRKMGRTNFLKVSRID